MTFEKTDIPDPGDWLTCVRKDESWRDNLLLATTAMQHAEITLHMTACVHGVPRVEVYGSSREYGIFNRVIGVITDRAEMADFIAFVYGRMGERAEQIVPIARHLMQYLPEPEGADYREEEEEGQPYMLAWVGEPAEA